MSWIFILSRQGVQESDVQSGVHDTPAHIASFQFGYIAVGGISETCFFNNDLRTQCGWAVVGIGITPVADRMHIMNRDEWENLITKESVDVSGIDGHFVILRWKQRQIEIFTDQLGLRTVYYSRYDGGFCISTRLDWVARQTRHQEVDFAAIGSRWLLFNQIGYDSGVVGIDRLGPGGKLSVRDGVNYHCTFNQWTPLIAKNSNIDAEHSLEELIQSAGTQGAIPSLGLSGGFDSRLLLAMMTTLEGKQYTVHTFGDSRDPDVLVAKQIALALNVQHHHFNEPLPDPDQCLNSIRSFVAQTMMVEPVTSFLKLRYYPKLRGMGRMMIDGGFGEIARRQYLNRIVRLGRRALQNREVCALLRLMRVRRGDFFRNDITKMMESGAQRNLQDALATMPEYKKIGAENYVDLFAVRHRVPNYGGPEQSRLDGEILNYMPLVQPSFLNSIFNMPVQIRANGKFYCNMIKKHNSLLTQFPLVKSGVMYPFGISTNMTWLFTRARAHFGHVYSDTNAEILLGHLRTYMLDTVHSKRFLENEMYDQDTILRAIDAYYRGESAFKTFAEWWLTFDIWSETLREPQKPN